MAVMVYSTFCITVILPKNSYIGAATIIRHPVFAIIPLYFYNGEKGRGDKKQKYKSKKYIVS